MSKADEFSASVERRRRATEIKHPPGFEPGLEYTDHGGTGVCYTDAELAAGELPDEDWLIDQFGLDPQMWAIVDRSLQVRKWQRWDGQWLHYVKANLRRRSPAEVEVLDTFRRRVLERPAVVHRRRTAGDRTFVLVITDTQIGKQAGGGTDAFIARICDSVDQAVARLLELRTRNHKLNRVAVLLGGDMLEGIGGNYAAQPFQIDLGLRDQLEVATAAVDYTIDRFIDVGVADLDVAFVPSNHGEQRSGKSIATSERDSTDLMIADQLRRAYGKAQRYRRVNIVVPWADHTTVCLDLNGERVGLAHGHQTGRKTVAEWWKGQIAGGPSRPLHDARILVVGHRHHLMVQETGDGRFVVQCPALEGGSPYFAELAGEASPPGVVTFVPVDGVPSELQLHRTR